MKGHERLELYKEYPQPGEEELAQKLADYLKWVMLNREFLSGTTTRDVHAKTVAALKAELTVDPDLPAEMRHGILREPRSWPAWVRYSSSFQTPRKDIKPDIRGMALKLMNVPGEKLLPQQEHATTQDFVCLSTDVFLTRDSQEFFDFMVAFNTNIRTAFWYIITHPKISLNFLESQKKYANLMEVQYFSGPQRLGEMAVRYSLKPRSSRQSRIPDDPGQNYLRDVIDQQLAREEVYYDFMVQVQKDPYRQPIENALVPWSQEISPYQKVATLWIPRQKVDTPERNWIGENLSMNAWHSLPAHRPLGNVNRTRKTVYIQISRFRHERNLVPMEEPTAGPDFLDPEEPAPLQGDIAMQPKTRSILKKLGIAVLVVAVIALAAYIFFPGLPSSVKVYDIVQLNQAWTPQDRQWFYHTSQGSQLMPYTWFISLEQPDSKTLFIDPDYLTRFRVIPDVNPANNPDRLPVGFAKDPGKPNPKWGVQVGITCAACHTGQLNYKGMGVRIDGAPGQLDTNGMLERLAAAIVTTDVDPLKFDRFARRVLGAGYNSTAKSQLKQQVRQYIGGQLEGILEQINADKDSGLEPTTAGFGRIDALGQGGNTLFGKLNKKNLATLNAPVDILPLWYAYSYGWVQTNSSIRQPMARNIIEALAVNSYLNLPGSPQDRELGYVSSVRMENSWQMEEMASKLKAPPWPDWLFGDLDPAKVGRGKVLYQELCASCHAPQLETPATNDGVAVLPGPYPPDPVAEAAGKRYYHLRIFDVDTIGTDPMDAVNFADRYADATAMGLSSHEWGPKIIYPVIAGIMKRYYADYKIPPEEQVVWNGYRANYWRAPKAYPARPLAGIWTSAPFLHNGSVPNLYELLSPVGERSNTFYRGSLEFDPELVGFETGRFYGGFKFDTSKTGNSNSGHEFNDGQGKGVIGRKLSDDERRALIEYLKALRFEDEVPPELAPPAGWPQNPGGASPSEGDAKPQNARTY